MWNSIRAFAANKPRRWRKGGKRRKVKISQPVLKVAVSKIRRRNAAHTTLQVQAIRVDQEEEDMLEAAPRRFKFTSGPSPTTRRIARPHPRGRERKKAAKILILRHRDGVQGAASGAIHTEENPPTNTQTRARNAYTSHAIGEGGHKQESTAQVQDTTAPVGWGRWGRTVEERP